MTDSGMLQDLAQQGQALSPPTALSRSPSLTTAEHRPAGLCSHVFPEKIEKLAVLAYEIMDDRVVDQVILGPSSFEPKTSLVRADPTEHLTICE